MATYKRKQGDSLWIDIACDALEEIDETWDNWTASWEISASVGSASVLNGNVASGSSISKDPQIGIFHLRIGPVKTEGWTSLAKGNYILTIQIDNSIADYRHEEQHILRIVSQGIVP